MPAGEEKVFRNQSLQECVQRKVIEWSQQSNEHVIRVKALANVFVSTGYPITLMDHPSFKALLTTLDPKFRVPGKRVILCNSINY